MDQAFRIFYSREIQYLLVYISLSMCSLDVFYFVRIRIKSNKHGHTSVYLNFLVELLSAPFNERRRQPRQTSRFNFITKLKS